MAQEAQMRQAACPPPLAVSYRVGEPAASGVQPGDCVVSPRVMKPSRYAFCKSCIAEGRAVSLLNNLTVRLMFQRDLAQVVDIDQRRPGKPWVQEDFLPVVEKPGTDGWVAEVDGAIVGFLVYRVTWSDADRMLLTLL